MKGVNSLRPLTGISASLTSYVARSVTRRKRSLRPLTGISASLTRSLNKTSPVIGRWSPSPYGD